MQGKEINRRFVGYLKVSLFSMRMPKCMFRMYSTRITCYVPCCFTVCCDYNRVRKFR